MIKYLKLLFTKKTEETKETKKCMYCLSRIPVYYDTCPYCRCGNFV